MFGGTDGPSFLTDSIRSASSKGESPKVKRDDLFDSKDDDLEDKDELFGASTSVSK